MLKHARISRRIILPLALAISLLFAFVPAVLVVTHAQSPSSHLVGPKANYLALGDSLAFGFQPCLLTSPPTCSPTDGYVYDLFNTLNNGGAGVTKSVKDLGCPSETSTALITGVGSKCYNSSLSQLATALAYLKANAGEVSPVTLDIGANDMLPDFTITPTGCTVSSAFNADLETLDSNLRIILHQLHEALTVRGQGVTGSIVMMNYYDPFQNICQASTQFIQDFKTFNTHLARDASGFATIVDVFTAFGGANTPNPNLCSLTWFTVGCTPSPTTDIHPTTLGYSVIAQTFAAAISPD